MFNPRQIIVHYAETPYDVWFDAIDIKQWHLEEGWDDGGYHYVITLDGCIEKGRDLFKKGAHCAGQNDDSIGICYIGGILPCGTLGDTRNKAQKDALELLIQSLRVCFPKSDLLVFGHNDYSQKNCPGYDAKHEHN